jgi:hypothetical protein
VKRVEKKPTAVFEHRQGKTHWIAPSEVRIMALHTSAEQDRRFLVALRTGPVSSIQAANDLDIVHPPSTVRRLRKNGHYIVTDWTYQATEPGRPPHRVAKYVLLQEAA